jgi:hypothetical protein
MHEFTEEEARAIEVDSAQRFDGRTMLVEVPDFDIRVVVAPYDRKGYSTYSDNYNKSPQTAYHSALLERLLYPDFATVESMRQRCAMLPENVATELEEEAGFTGLSAIIAPLDLKRLPQGLDAGTAARLASEAGALKLWSVENPAHGLSCVLRAPTADNWIAARTLHDDARKRSEGVIDSLDPYILGARVWSSEPLVGDGIGSKGLLDLKPALWWNLKRAFLRMGGDGAAVRRKSLRDAVARNPDGPKPAV